MREMRRRKTANYRLVSRSDFAMLLARLTAIARIAYLIHELIEIHLGAVLRE